MPRSQALVTCRYEDTEILAQMYREGIISGWNGTLEADETMVLAVQVRHPAAFERLRNHPKFTVLPAAHDFTPGALRQEHLDKLPAVAKAGMNLGMNGHDFAKKLHDNVKHLTTAFDPDF